MHPTPTPPGASALRSHGPHIEVQPRPGQSWSRLCPRATPDPLPGRPCPACRDDARALLRSRTFHLTYVLTVQGLTADRRIDPTDELLRLLHPPQDHPDLRALPLPQPWVAVALRPTGRTSCHAVVDRWAHDLVHPPHPQRVARPRPEGATLCGRPPGGTGHAAVCASCLRLLPTLTRAVHRLVMARSTDLHRRRVLARVVHPDAARLTPPEARTLAGSVGDAARVVIGSAALPVAGGDPDPWLVAAALAPPKQDGGDGQSRASAYRAPHLGTL